MLQLLIDFSFPISCDKTDMLINFFFICQYYQGRIKKIKGQKCSTFKCQMDFPSTLLTDSTSSLQGIGEKRASFILELREESPEPFKSVSL